MRIPILLARIVSIVAHPLVLLPAAALFTAIEHDATDEVLHALSVAMGILVLIVFAFAVRQVHSGTWQHVDASQPPERRTLNVFLAVLFLVGGLLVWFTFPVRQLAIALFAAAFAMLTAQALAKWLKLSQHVCFAMFAAGLLWPNRLAVGVGLALVIAIAWSRVKLGRHTRIDTMAGAAMGLICVAGYHLIIR